MLKKFHIANFLSCKDTEIELDQVTALIGRNAAGKTNILKAIQWCAQFAVGNMPLYEHFSQFGSIRAVCNIEFSIDDQVFKYEIKITKNGVGLGSIDRKEDIVLMESLFCSANDKWQLIADREDVRATYYFNEEAINVEINSEAPMISALLSLLPKKGLDPTFNKIYNYLSEIKYYTLEDDQYKNGNHGGLANIVIDNSYQEWLSSKDNKQKPSVVMRLLHLWHVDKDLLEELQALIGKNGLNLVNNISISKSTYGDQNEYFYSIRFVLDNASVNYTQLSYGTQRVLTLLFALLYDKNSALLIEQPEDGIHSGLLRKLLPLCFEYGAVYNKQIIITTHSSDVINLLPPESIRLVKMTENGTKVSSLSKEQLPFIYEFLEDEGALFDFIESMDDE